MDPDTDLARKMARISGRIAYGNNRFYVADAAGGKIYAYASSGERDEASDIDVIGTPSCMTYANNRLYVVVSRTRQRRLPQLAPGDGFPQLSADYRYDVVEVHTLSGK